MMAGRYAPLIAATLEQVSQHRDFPQWVLAGEIPAQVVKILLHSAKTSYGSLPTRWCASAQRQVQETYKAWLKRRTAQSSVVCIAFCRFVVEAGEPLRRALAG
jgi:hypothetical protein